MRTVLLLGAAAVLFAACSSAQTYRGPGRADAQVATIVPENAWNRARASVAPAASGQVGVRIGGRRLGFAERSFEVLPGRHQLEVVYRNEQTPWREWILTTRPVVLALDAQAGRTYGVRARPEYTPRGVSITLFAVDAATGATVARVGVPQDKIVLRDAQPGFEWDDDDPQ